MEAQNTKPARYTITSALPYANGPVHIGHLAGVYVPADIYARYLRLKGEQVLFIGGSDEHGVPITIKAKQEGVSPQDIVDKYHGIIEKSFQEFGISFDVYSRTSRAIHHETAREFFKTLYDDGIFIEKTTEQLYDEAAGQFLADRYVTGTCPHCSSDGAYGDQCEKCGTSLNATDLIHPKSVLSGQTPVKKMTKHWYLPLDRYESWLRKWILEEHATDWKINVYGQCKSWLDQGLQPRAVTRDLDWGVRLPIPDSEGKVLYVWFDAPIGYISATKEWAAQRGVDWKPYWKSEDTELLHFIGKDNIVFHCIIFPAMLHAEGSYILPKNIPANEFLNLEGDKISTSRNWAVWLHEYLLDFPEKQDVLRYVLCSIAPETKDNDFSWKDFQQRNNSELVAIYGNFVNRAMVLTAKYFDAKVPAANHLSEMDTQAIQAMKEIPQKIEAALSKYRFREALQELMNLARLGNKYLADTEPWKRYATQKEEVGTILHIALQMVAQLGVLSQPFLPFTAAKIFQMLNLNPTDWKQAGSSDLLKEGHALQPSFLLFDQITDEAVAAQVAKLQHPQPAPVSSSLLPQKEAVSFDEFSRMDLRLGTIVAAEKVAKTQKLLKISIDTGLDTRTVVSGIAEFYSPEEIIGKQVSLLINLEERDIKGIRSQGMILMAAAPDGKLRFVHSEEGMPNGCCLK